MRGDLWVLVSSQPRLLRQMSGQGGDPVTKAEVKAPGHGGTRVRTSAPSLQHADMGTHVPLYQKNRAESSKLLFKNNQTMSADSVEEVGANLFTRDSVMAKGRYIVAVFP